MAYNTTFNLCCRAWGVRLHCCCCAKGRRRSARLLPQPLKKKTMNYFEEVFNPQQFVRVHRSYIVQVSQITKIETMEKDSHIALLKTGVKIPLSKSGYTKLKVVLGL